MAHFHGNTGTLIIVIARAKDLPNKRKLEKQNPYCLLRISNLTDKTKPDIRGGQNPLWDAEFRFNMVPEIQPILKLSILDETKKAPTLVAEAEIDFTPVYYSSVKEGYDKWHTLYSSSREAGEIYIEMTFYPSAGLGTSGSLSSSGTSKKQSKTSKRALPAIPGQEPIHEPEESQDYAIPLPLPRTGSPSRFQSSEFPEIPTHQETYSDTHEEGLRKSFMDIGLSSSITNIPDIPPSRKYPPEIPMHSHSLNELPERFAQNSMKEPTNIRLTDQQAVESPKISDHVFESPLATERERQVPDFKGFAKKLTNRYSIPLFGSNKEKDPEQEKKSPKKEKEKELNPFDELEREVQSDWERNNKVTKTRPHKSPPPPVPSHGSHGSHRTLNSSGGSSIMPMSPVPPHHSSGSLPRLPAIELPPIDVPSTPPQSPRRKESPTRKPPSNFYKSGPTSPARVDLSSIPYDASDLSSSQKDPDIQFIEERSTSKKDDDVLLERHQAPTPYEAFVEKTRQLGLGDSNSSPTRFRAS